VADADTRASSNSKIALDPAVNQAAMEPVDWIECDKNPYQPKLS
jgi:hypothetical protein